MEQVEVEEEEGALVAGQDRVEEVEEALEVLGVLAALVVLVDPVVLVDLEDQLEE